MEHHGTWMATDILVATHSKEKNLTLQVTLLCFHYLHTLFSQPGPAPHHPQSKTLVSNIKLKSPRFWFKVIRLSIFTIRLS